MSDDIFIIIKSGYYRQNILGAYITLEQARNNAIIAIKKENDDYHSMIIGKLKLNQDCEDCEEVLEISRNGNEIITDKTMWGKVWLKK